MHDRETAAARSDEFAEQTRRWMDDLAKEIGLAAVAHLQIHYPAALKAVPVTAQRSLRNCIAGDVRRRVQPLLKTVADSPAAREAMRTTW